VNFVHKSVKELSLVIMPQFEGPTTTASINCPEFCKGGITCRSRRTILLIKFLEQALSKSITKDFFKRAINRPRRTIERDMILQIQM
jgi:hypothetical protein